MLAALELVSGHVHDAEQNLANPEHDRTKPFQDCFGFCIALMEWTNRRQINGSNFAFIPCVRYLRLKISCLYSEVFAGVTCSSQNKKTFG